MRHVSKAAVLVLVLLALAAAGVRSLAPRPAQASMRADDGASIATCALPEIVNLLMQSDRFQPAREDYSNELQEELRPLAERLQSLMQEMQTMTPEDEGAEAKARQFQQLQQEFAQKRDEVGHKLESFTAGQIVECYKLVRSSAQAVAEDLGYDYVISTIGSDEDLNSDSVDTVLRQMMARPVIMAPEDAEITDDVKEDLNLE